MYERQKRELHAERNRRLLRQIAKSEKLKENNQTLVRRESPLIGLLCRRIKNHCISKSCDFVLFFADYIYIQCKKNQADDIIRRHIESTYMYLQSHNTKVTEANNICQ